MEVREQRDLIRAIRILRRLRQKDVAAKLGISPAKLCRIEKGLIPLRRHELQRLSEILNVDPETLREAAQ